MFKSILQFENKKDLLANNKKKINYKETFSAPKRIIKDLFKVPKYLASVPRHKIHRSRRIIKPNPNAARIVNKQYKMVRKPNLTKRNTTVWKEL